MKGLILLLATATLSLGVPSDVQHPLLISETTKYAESRKEGRET